MSPRPLVKRTPDGRRYPVPSTPVQSTPVRATSAPDGRSKCREELNDDDLRRIRADYAAGKWSLKDLAYIYSVSTPRIRNIVKPKER